MINVVIFSGGRGAKTLIPALLNKEGVNLTSVVNAYDDGKSTGEIREFFKMLGPSDIRKVQENMIPENHIDYKAIIGLFEYRYPINVTKEEVWEDFFSFVHNQKESLSGFYFQDEKIKASLKEIIKVLLKGLSIIEKAENKQLNYGDCSIMNLIYAGAYLYFKGNFEDTTIFIDKLFSLRGTVLPTNIEDKKLLAIREDGTILFNEAEIVELRANTRIKKIYLLDQYPDRALLSNMSIDEVEDYFEIMNRQVAITSRVERSIKDADIIIYVPGTQHSSLYPSYMSKGLTEAIVNNRRAVKIFITNIGEDYETPSYTASDFINGAIRYLKMGAEFKVDVNDIFTHALVNNKFSGNLENYVKYDLTDLETIGCNIILDEFENPDSFGKHDGIKLAKTIMNLYLKKFELKL